MFGRGARLLLYIDFAGATLAVWQGGRLRATRQFADNPAGHAACTHFTSGYAHLPVHITVETYEEDYRAHMLPRASGRDRTQMLQRKLATLYPGSRFRGVCSQGKREPGGRECSYLFAALTNEQPLQAWIDALTAAQCEIAAVHPLALLLVGLATFSGAIGGKQLLVVGQRNAVRHLFLDAHGLRLNRLTRVHAPGALADEIRHTRSYLENAKLIGTGEQICCAVMDPHNALNALRGAHPRLSVVALDMAALTKALRTDPPDPRSVALALLGRSAPRMNFADARMTAGHRARRRRFNMHLATVLLAVATAIGTFTGARALDALQAEQARLAMHVAMEGHRVDQRANSRPQKRSAAQLEKMVDAANHLQRAFRSPRAAYFLASRVMDLHPELMLERIDWRSAQLASPMHAARAASALESMELHFSLPDTLVSGTTRRDAINTVLADLESQDTVSRVTLRRTSEGRVDATDSSIGPDTIPATFQVLVHLGSGE